MAKYRLHSEHSTDTTTLLMHVTPLTSSLLTVSASESPLLPLVVDVIKLWTSLILELQRSSSDAVSTPSTRRRSNS